MVDIIDNKWTERDDGNISAAPDGVQGGYSPKTVAPIIRAIRGAVKREWVSSNPAFTSTGTANNYDLSFDQPLEIGKGKRISFFANVTNTGASTINLNTLGAVAIVRNDGSPLQAGDIVANMPVDLVYDGTRFVLTSSPILSNISGTIKATAFEGNGSALTNINASNISSGTLNNARLPSTMTGKTFSSETTISDGGLKITDGGLVISAGGAGVGGDLAVTGKTNLVGDTTVVGTLSQGGNAVLTTANQPFLLARANHTGTQPVSTVAGLQATIDSLNASVAALESAMVQRMPTGSITIWATETPPDGWVLCNGAAISRTTYAALFAVIGGYYGVGNGSTTFNVPDFRGLFVRGKDNGRGLDPNRALGSYQDSDNKSHSHGVNDPGHNHGGVQNGTASTGRSTAVDQPPAVFSYGYTWNSATGISIRSSGGDESRPRNIAMNYIIKT
ncbi:tail fiber protein [Agrobacterium leguminum]|uniref:tail fiber protein n=1 Tax=Agrobacterium leguminum TaxID=2792015 RepID=UPI0022B81CCD|nr:tail fiber protein [Agrobacterium leguminum]MCZ7931092.1 tail fiber protein [Agrobacterium leguminum]